MARQGYWLTVGSQRQSLPSRSEAPFENGARSATEACSSLQRYGIDVGLVTLRWFQNKGLIEKPNKEGRNAIYPRPVLEEVASIRILQTLYGRSVEELETLRRRGLGFTETLEHLLRLERTMPLRGFPDEPKKEASAWSHTINRIAMVGEFFDTVVRGGADPAYLRCRGLADGGIEAAPRR